MNNEKIIAMFGTLQPLAVGFMFLPSSEHPELSPVIYATPDREKVAATLAENLKRIRIQTTLEKILS